ncbi:MAG: deoxyguanosinetriphosphate triphosphohydrolase [Lachnospiraceae bacterium]|nr:deoxyguanosinetriphosphate triphosphohydrolase [Lachnospiraceae bacterium]
MAVKKSIREQQEEFEYTALSEYASRSRESEGRDREEEPCPIRTDYQRDRDRIIHCKAFRRLKDKTQVFLSPQGDHYRTRLTHTLEVSQIARTIAKALRLNTDLVEAIALAHDLGHTPFGHAGEDVLNKECSLGFRHNEQSVRVVELLEKDGRGLNLTKEVRDGILNHRTGMKPHTIEAEAVKISDKLAYMHHDMDDAIRAGVITEEDIPLELKKLLGSTCRERLNTLVLDIVNRSMNRPHIKQTRTMEQGYNELRTLMFRKVYFTGAAKKENPKVDRMLTEMYRYYIKNPFDMAYEYTALILKGEPVEKVVCDYISGMTDQYAIHIFEELFIPKGWEIY